MKKIISYILSVLTLSTSALFGSSCGCETAPVQRTLSIIKPDAVADNHIGEIFARFEKEGLKVVAAKMVRLTPEKASAFYLEHKERPFYPSLVAFMSSGPILVQVLEGQDAIAKNREIMGSTSPSLAKSGTLRALYATSVEKNAVHGSDSKNSAVREIDFFFTKDEIFSR